MTKDTKSKKVSRRKFLKNAALTGTILSFTSMRSKAAAQETDPMIEMINKVIREAVKMKNMEDAIAKYGTSLSKEVKDVLLTLTPQDPEALKTLGKKVAPKGVVMMGGVRG